MREYIKLFVVVRCFWNDECLRFASWKLGKHFGQKQFPKNAPNGDLVEILRNGAYIKMRIHEQRMSKHPEDQELGNWLVARVLPKNRQFSMGKGSKITWKQYLVDHPRSWKWLGSPPFYEPFTPFGRGNNLVEYINHGYYITKCKRSEANLDQGSLSPIFVEYPSSPAWQEGACILMSGLRVSLVILFLTSGVQNHS